MSTNDINKKIVEKIKSARTERKLNQKQLADKLGKTQATLSQLENGNVQVLASELYKISEILDKPIEYFYGEDIGNDEIQEIVTMLRRQTPADIRDLYNPIKLLVGLKDIENIARLFPKNQKVPREKVIEFSEVIFPLINALNKTSEKVKPIAEMITKALEVDKLEIPKTKK